MNTDEKINELLSLLSEIPDLMDSWSERYKTIEREIKDARSVIRELAIKAKKYDELES